MARTEKTGCIKRKPSALDGRATHVHLTAKGQRKLEEIARLNDELGRTPTSGFSEPELEAVSRFLRHVVDVANRL